jgi:hypothetical protein
VYLPTGWIGAQNGSPKRQILFCLAAAISVTPGIGEPRTFSTGDAWLMEDTEGMGHKPRVTLDEPFEAVIVQLPDSSRTGEPISNPVRVDKAADARERL